MHVRSLLPTLFGLLLGCGTAKQMAKVPAEDQPAPPVETEIRHLDTLVVTPEPEPAPIETPNYDLPVYWASATRRVDLLHTSLDLAFDWQEEAVIGQAHLTLTPYFYAVDTFVLDAKGFEINSVKESRTGQPLDYKYDGRELKIALQTPHEKGDTIQLSIDYVAHPSTGESASRAITSDKGLFFINPRGEEGSKPQQIWTQGETDFNSRWFPTIDHPNERCTQQIRMTVDNRFTTLSNGVLVSSEAVEEGKRADLWIMDLPHAPYLFMVAVGEFAVVTETWNGIDVSYYVEEKYEEDAKAIFAHTREMLDFFSEYMGLDYPWQKYAQIVVRDYVSGAMENTTAVIFGDFVQRHQRELIDNGNDYIVAHELIHHWFGDYVTCESWSNLTLNEGFANYGEYLWFEHKYGEDRADHHRQQELQGYLYEASNHTHPLIEFGYDEHEDMFDAHSYNKGGLVLHMLRKYVGEKAFKVALNTYLNEHAFDAAEVHDLRLAFEDVTGEDLNWFFNQWYLDEGHPELDFAFEWKPAQGELQLSFEQVQDPDEHAAVFVLPTEIEIYYVDGTRERLPVTLNERKQVMSIALEKEPDFVVLDPGRDLLAQIYCQDYSPKDYHRMYQPDNALAVRTAALQAIFSRSDSASVAVKMSALRDPFWSVRSSVLDYVPWAQYPDYHDMIVDAARQDPHSQVRASAIRALGHFGSDQDKAVIAESINSSEAYPVVGAAIRTLHQLDPVRCTQEIAALRDEQQADIVAALSSIYSESGDTTHLTYFTHHMASVQGLPALEFYTHFEEILSMTSDTTQDQWLSMSGEVASNTSSSPYTKIAAVRMMCSFLTQYKGDRARQLRDKIMSIVASESNQQIREIYASFLGT